MSIWALFGTQQEKTTTVVPAVGPTTSVHAAGKDALAAKDAPAGKGALAAKVALAGEDARCAKRMRRSVQAV